MFDFEKFPVYIKSEEVYLVIVKQILPHKDLDRNLREQLRRASMSIALNIAEGAGKFSKKDKKNFYVIARGSNQECVALIRILKLEGKISDQLFDQLYSDFTEISKMLSGLINSMIGK